ncbi:hypothetical protein BDW02DRAFT_644558 [Decorospora gaudefroyi]|uniref:ATP synthase subunit delta, mitochondrial n=1 Tax=Decorospora gaudefroyi TaxID=184978 RepID=A0A6A5KQY6_9PLEO|nr:hypothetical protein BDW02DRAFT_644558 [Decorospora gaudefroyi]
MSALRIARATLRARPAAIARPLQRRGYAEVANDKIKLSLALPHQSIYKSQDVVQVNLPAETGDMGVLANHVASIEQLKPGLVEIIEEQGGSKQFFLSGGFAVVQPNSVLSINAVEGYPLEDFSAEAVRNQIGEAQKIASGSGSEADIAEAKIELESFHSTRPSPSHVGKASRGNAASYMPRGFDQPTSSSVSRAINTGPPQRSIVRTRQGRFDAPVPPPGVGDAKEPQRISSGEEPTKLSDLTAPQQSSKDSTPSAGRKSPAYLQGKNPYGQILEGIEHPYREIRATAALEAAAAAEDGPPSQLGSSTGKRPRTSGSFESRTRSLPQEPRSDRADPPSEPQAPPGRWPLKLTSVRAKKDFWETRVSQATAAPQPPSSGKAASTRGTLPKPQPPSPPRDRHARTPSPPHVGRASSPEITRAVSPPHVRIASPEITRIASPQPVRTPEREEAGSGLLLQSLIGFRPVESALSVIPFPQGEGNQLNIDVVELDRLSSDVAEFDHPRADVTTELNQSIRDVDEIDQLFPALVESNQPPPDVVVRKPTPPLPTSLLSDAQSESETEQESTGRRRSTNIFAEAPREAKPFGLDSRAANETPTLDTSSNPPFISHEVSRSAGQLEASEETVRRPFTHSSLSAAETREVETTKHLKSQQEDRRTKSGGEIRRAFENSPKRLARRGSRSAPLTEGGGPSEERTTKRTSSNSTSTDFEAFRSKFGQPVKFRKKAEDIAARGLSHDGSTSPCLSRRSSASGLVPTANVGVQEQYYSLEVPEHVDYRAAYGRRKTPDFGYPGARIKPHAVHRTNRPLQDPGNWVKRACGHFSYMGKDELREHAQKRACRQCLTRTPPPEPQRAPIQRTRKRAGTDSSTSNASSSKKFKFGCNRRRQNHSGSKCENTLAKDLGHLIDSILEEHKKSLQAVINDIKRSQPSLTRLQNVSEDQSGGVCAKQEMPALRLYAMPKAAEKLNVGPSGQLNPNMNDSRATLRKAINSMHELIDLVNSVADDLGVDLDQRPTSSDELMFRNAPLEGTSQAPVLAHQDPFLGATAEQDANDELAKEDSWIQRTRKHLTELSDTREQLMDELELIAQNLGVLSRQTSKSPSELHESPECVTHDQYSGKEESVTRQQLSNPETPQLLLLSQSARPSSSLSSPRESSLQFNTCHPLQTQVSESFGCENLIYESRHGRESTEPDLIPTPTSLLLTGQTSRSDSLCRTPSDHAIFPSIRRNDMYLKEKAGTKFETQDPEQRTEPGILPLSIPRQATRWGSDSTSTRPSLHRQQLSMESSTENEDPADVKRGFGMPLRRVRQAMASVIDRSATREEQSIPSSGLTSSSTDINEEAFTTLNNQARTCASAESTIRPDVAEKQATDTSDETYLAPATHQSIRVERWPLIQPRSEASAISEIFPTFTEHGFELEHVVTSESMSVRLDTVQDGIGLRDLTTSSSEPREYASMQEMRARSASRRRVPERLQIPLERNSSLSILGSDTPLDVALESDSVGGVRDRVMSEKPILGVSQTPTTPVTPVMSTQLSLRFESLRQEDASSSISETSDSTSSEVTVIEDRPAVAREFTSEKSHTSNMPAMAPARTQEKTPLRKSEPAEENCKNPETSDTSSSTWFAGTRKNSELSTTETFRQSVALVRHPKRQPSMSCRLPSSSETTPSPVEGRRTLRLRHVTRQSTRQSTRPACRTVLLERMWSSQTEESEKDEGPDRVLDQIIRRPTWFFQQPISSETTSSSSPCSRQPAPHARRLTTGGEPLNIVSPGEGMNNSETEPTVVPKPQVQQDGYHGVRGIVETLVQVLEPKEPSSASSDSRVTTVTRTPTPVAIEPQPLVKGLAFDKGRDADQTFLHISAHAKPSSSSNSSTTSSGVPPPASTETQLLVEDERVSFVRRARAWMARQPTRAARTQTAMPTPQNPEPESDDTTEEPYISADDGAVHFTYRISTPLDGQRPGVAVTQASILVQRDVELEFVPQEPVAKTAPTELLMHKERLPGAWPASTYASPEATPPGTVIKVVELQPTQGTVIESDFSHPSLFDEPLASHNVYHATPAKASEDSFEAASPEVRRIPVESEPVSKLQEDLAAISLSSSPSTLSSQESGDPAPVRQPSVRRHRGEPALELKVKRRTRKPKPTTLLEAVPEDQPDQFDTAPNAGLAHELESLAALVVQKETEAPPERSHRAKPRRIRASPEIDVRVPRVLTVPPAKDARRISAAPGIVAPPPETIKKDMEIGARSLAPPKKRRKIVNYPPDQQYPPAPAWPQRETPSWTKPDTHTPPPRPKAESPPRKRGWFRWSIKPKAAPRPIQRAVSEPEARPSPAPAPDRDRQPPQPFQAAAPGVPGPSGGTLQRQRGYYYTKPPGRTHHHPHRQTAASFSSFRKDYYPPRRTSVYANKDSYFPRLSLLVYDSPQPQLAPARRNCSSHPQSASAPARSKNPTTSSTFHPVRRAAHPRPRTPSRARSAPTPGNKPSQQSLCSYPPAPSSHQPRCHQNPRHQATPAVHPPHKTRTSSSCRSQTHSKPVCARPLTQIGVGVLRELVC